MVQREKKNLVRKTKTETSNREFFDSVSEKSVLATMQQQIGNRAIQRLLVLHRVDGATVTSPNQSRKLNSSSIFRKSTKPTLITLPVMDRIEDAYAAGTLDTVQWRNLLDSAQQAYTKGRLDDAKNAYKRLYVDVAKLARADQVVNFSGNTSDINIANWDKGKGTTAEAKPGLNLTLASYGDLDAAGKTAYVDQKGGFSTTLRLAGGVLPFVAILLCRDAFHPDKEQTLAVLRHEMVHAEHLTIGEVGVSDPKTKSGYVDYSSANTELLAYVEGFMTMFHLRNANDDTAFVELLGVLDGSHTHAWAGASHSVQSEALGRLQEYYCNALSPRHQRSFDDWVSAKLSKARRDELYAPSRAEKIEINSGKRQATPEEITGNKVRETRAVDFYESLQSMIARQCKGLKTSMAL